MTEKAIIEALQKAVIAAVAALPAASRIPVKYIGRNFTKPSDGKWLEVVYIPNNVPGEFWGEGKTYQGMLRLILHWPMDNQGAYTPTTLIEAIGAYFAKGTKFTDAAVTVRVMVKDQPNLMGVMEEPPEMLYPLSIRYHFFKA